MKIETLKRIKQAATNMLSADTWNSDDVNLLRNQAELIQEKLYNLHEPRTTSTGAWSNYDRKHDALQEKLKICLNPRAGDNDLETQKKNKEEA